MVEPLSLLAGAALKFGGREVVKRWNELRDRNTQALQEASAADGRRWRAERDQHVELRLQQLQARVDAGEEALAATLERLLPDGQFWRLQDNYEFEAAREATDERRRMLAFAAAWSVDPELSIAELGRVERTIRELDPDDVVVLKRLAELGKPVPPPLPEGQGDANYEQVHRDRQVVSQHLHEQTLFENWWRERPRAEILPAAGCVLITTQPPVAGQTSSLEITGLGRTVLQVLDGYLRARS